MTETYTIFDNRPPNCRFRLRDEGSPYPKSGCTACGASIRNGLVCRYTETAPSETTDTTPRLYTQTDLDRIVRAAVDYASQAAAQEARAVALRVAEKVCRQASEKYAAFAYDRENEEGRLQNAAKCYAANEIGDTIFALIDTPTAEALERVRAEERKACAQVAFDLLCDAGEPGTAAIVGDAIRARGET